MSARACVCACVYVCVRTCALVRVIVLCLSASSPAQLTPRPRARTTQAANLLTSPCRLVSIPDTKSERAVEHWIRNGEQYEAFEHRLATRVAARSERAHAAGSGSGGGSSRVGAGGGRDSFQSFQSRLPPKPPKPSQHPIAMATACDYCGRAFSKGAKKKCVGCERVFYCSVACQKKDWKAGHKQR